MLLYFIRHGETDWNNAYRIMGLNPIRLNERGRERVERLAEALADRDIPVIYTSTVMRAVETTQILADAWGAKICEEPRLNESDYERWVGKRYEELKGDPDFELYGSAPTRSTFSENEGMIEIQRRAVEAIERIREEIGEGMAAAVSHSDVMKPVIAYYLQMDLDAMHRLAISNASVTLLDIGGKRPRLRYINLAPWKW
jgi:broad specificity phosphatase PhoE